jgi:HAD-hyrolase-like
VLTGNTTAVARIKLQAFGLDGYLDLRIGAYGDDHRDRTELVNIARHRCGRLFGPPVESGQVVVIGDTPSDVEASLAAGAHVIAVASGKYDRSDLAAAGADSVLSTLADLPGLRRALGEAANASTMRFPELIAPDVVYLENMTSDLSAAPTDQPASRSRETCPASSPSATPSTTASQHWSSPLVNGSHS